LTTTSNELVNQAILFLRCSNQIIEPRKKWIKDSLLTYRFSGNIKDNLKAEEGRVLLLALNSLGQSD
jgi:ATP-dependent DNA helicase RecQ